ncbi:MAG: hypothetical protein IJV40_16165, partial [Oscillospiraceae bacterium]|nr:hypothetical protein [Oscillospiraceae bacterium]
RRLAAGMAKRRGHLLGKGAPKSENPNITYILCTMFGAMLPTISAEEPFLRDYSQVFNIFCDIAGFKRMIRIGNDAARNVSFPAEPGDDAVSYPWIGIAGESNRVSEGEGKSILKRSIENKMSSLRNRTAGCDLGSNNGPDAFPHKQNGIIFGEINAGKHLSGLGQSKPAALFQLAAVTLDFLREPGIGESQNLKPGVGGKPAAEMQERLIRRISDTGKEYGKFLHLSQRSFPISFMIQVRPTFIASFGQNS